MSHISISVHYMFCIESFSFSPLDGDSDSEDESADSKFYM